MNQEIYNENEQALKEFLLDMSPAGGQAHFKAMRKLASEHPSEKVGREIRKLYSWNGEDKLLDN